MKSDCHEIINIGSDEMISINNLAKMVINISGKDIQVENIPGPEGVRGRNSENSLIKKELGWKPSKPLVEGVLATYNWVEEMVKL